MSREGVRVEKKRVERSASRELSRERVERSVSRELSIERERQRQSRERDRVETDVERETE